MAKGMSFGVHPWQQTYKRRPREPKDKGLPGKARWTSSATSNREIRFAGWCPGCKCRLLECECESREPLNFEEQ
jgi:hypothetical protein